MLGILDFFINRLQRIKILNKYFDFSKPLIVSNILGCLIAITDTYMVMQLGESQVSASRLVNFIFIILYVFLISASFVITSHVSSKFDASNHGGTTSLFKSNIVMNFGLGICVVLFAAACYPGLYFLKKNTDLINLAKPYFLMTIFSLIPSSVYITLVRHLKAISKTKAIMISNMILYALNISLNYIFINGKFGFPAMMLLGAALGTFTARFIATMLLFVYCLHSHSCRKFFSLLRGFCSVNK